MSGLSHQSKLTRKNRNKVTMKYNLINLTLHLMTTILLANVQHFSAMILFWTMSGVLPPLVYYAGIEDNRRKVKDYLLLSLDKVNKKENTKNSNQAEIKDGAHQLFYKKTFVEEIND